MLLAQLLNTVVREDEPVLPSAINANVEFILKVVRTHLGMDMAFASHVTPTHVIIQHMNADEHPPFAAGDAFPVDDGYCKRILEGRLPRLIHDAAAVPEVAELACTRDMPIGAHLSVPLRLSDGTVHGTFCCFSASPDYSLNNRDVSVMSAFAELAAGQIEAGLAHSAQADQLKERVSKVIQSGQIRAFYQPIYDLASNQIVGVEALARFPDADNRGPDKWFAEAAEVGLGVDLELAAIRAALKGLPHIPADVYLSINVSPATLLDDQLGDILAQVSPGRLVVEVTEHAIIRDYVLLEQALELLRPRVLIAVDDAGAGYSGLSHILNIRPDIIKLDLKLTRDIDKDPARAALARAMMTFGSEIGSSIVAEGIETAEELSTLKALGVYAGQGYFLQRPKPISAVTGFLAARKLGATDEVGRHADQRDQVRQRQKQLLSL